MKNTKKSLIVYMLLFVVLAGCHKEQYDYSGMTETYNCIDSVVSYSMKVPLSTEQEKYEIFFNAPFYRVYSGEDKNLDLLSTQNHFQIGDEVQLEGENVEILDGAEVTMYKKKLSESIDYDAYCSRMAYFYGMEHLGKKATEEVDEDTLESIKTIISDVADDYTVLTINISFDGCVYDEVVVNGLKIDSLGFEFEFDEFTISTFEFNDGIMENDDNIVVDYTASVGGLFADVVLSEVGFVEIMGDVQRDIKDIEVESLDDDVTVITADNYAQYRELEDAYGVLYDNNPSSYNKGDTISACYSHISNVGIDDVDAKMSNISICYVMEDGTRICRFVYQPKVVDGPYLLMDKLKEYID